MVTSGADPAHELPREPRLPLGPRARPGVLRVPAPPDRDPLGAEVAVEVDAAPVQPGAELRPVRVEVVDDPEIEPRGQVPVPQPLRDVDPASTRFRGCSRRRGSCEGSRSRRDGARGSGGRRGSTRGRRSIPGVLGLAGSMQRGTGRDVGGEHAMGTVRLGARVRDPARVSPPVDCLCCESSSSRARCSRSPRRLAAGLARRRRRRAGRAPGRGLPSAAAAGGLAATRFALGEPSGRAPVCAASMFPGEGPELLHMGSRPPPDAQPRLAAVGHDRLVRLLLRVIAATRRPTRGSPGGDRGPEQARGGPFGPVHATHQNGLDADVYYPRRDRQRAAAEARLADRPPAGAGSRRPLRRGRAHLVYVGPNTGFTGPADVVQVLWNHDNHLHVRIDAKTG